MRLFLLCEYERMIFSLDEDEAEIDSSLLIPEPVTTIEGAEEKSEIRAPNLPPPDKAKEAKTNIDFLSKITATGPEMYPSMNPHSLVILFFLLPTKLMHIF